MVAFSLSLLKSKLQKPCAISVFFCMPIATLFWLCLRSCHSSLCYPWPGWSWCVFCTYQVPLLHINLAAGSVGLMAEETRIFVDSNLRVHPTFSSLAMSKHRHFLQCPRLLTVQLHFMCAQCVTNVGVEYVRITAFQSWHNTVFQCSNNLCWLKSKRCLLFFQEVICMLVESHALSAYYTGLLLPAMMFGLLLLSCRKELY